jgi:hypothetical protein
MGEDDNPEGKELDNRLLSKLHLVVKIALFGIFIVKFFDQMSAYALKI